MEFADKVFGSDIESIFAIADVVIADSVEFSFEEISSIAQWMLLKIESVGANGRITELVSILCGLVNSEKMASTVVNMIEELPDAVFRKEKDKYISMLVDILRKQYGKGMNERVITLAKRHKVEKKVIELAPDSMSKELKEYAKGKA